MTLQEVKMAYRSGLKLWDQLDYRTGKRIKGYWRQVPKMARLLTLANERKSLGMSTDEIDRLAKHIHDHNVEWLGTEADTSA